MTERKKKSEKKTAQVNIAELESKLEEEAHAEIATLVDGFKLTSPPDRDPDGDEVVRVNLFISKSLHKRIRKYAIDHDDKSLVATIQDVLDAYLRQERY